jgi:hypothetical protein
MKRTFIIISLSLLTAISCKKEVTPIVIDANSYHNAVDRLTSVIVHDIFSPPVASRIYAYSNIAAYEVMAQQNDQYESLSGKVTGLGPAPVPREEINTEMATLVAQIEIGKNLIFSEDKLIAYRDSLYSDWKTKNEDLFEASRAYGMEMADHIKAWMAKDNYKQTRTMPKFTVNSDEVSRWKPTPPMYMDGIEPHWSKIRPFVLDSAAQFKPVPHPDFSMDQNSDFYKELKEVFELGGGVNPEDRDPEHVEIAKFWDCNPYVSTTKGHLMFATKKITPGGHWIGICKIACKTDGADFNKTVYAYTKTSIALADGFISCWDEKYRSNLIRPETLINETMNENWFPVLQTPPFPEYTSGHSVVSGAASVVLTQIFGDDFHFVDDTELVYGLPIRTFDSFYQASSEAAISRLYGGIHYRAAIDNGLIQGKLIGNYVASNLQMTANETN